MSDRTRELIREHGNEAYTVAVRLASLALQVGDTEGAEMFAECARELLQAGQHKKEGAK